MKLNLRDKLVMKTLAGVISTGVKWLVSSTKDEEERQQKADNWAKKTEDLIFVIADGCSSRKEFVTHLKTFRELTRLLTTLTGVSHTQRIVGMAARSIDERISDADA